MSASQVAESGAAYNNSLHAGGNVTFNINQQLSRSDIIAIASEQKRLTKRG